MPHPFAFFCERVGGRNLNSYKSRTARVGIESIDRSLLPTLAKERKDGAPRVVVIPARNQRVAHPLTFYTKGIMVKNQLLKSTLSKGASAVLILALSYLGLFSPLERLMPFERTPGFWIADIIFPRGTHYNIGARGFTALGIDFALCVLVVFVLWSIVLRRWRKVKT